ncbi:MAG: hypothetical protein ACUVS2_03185 [Candidatus Flexifilum sp.]|jgi:hypothetical protein
MADEPKPLLNRLRDLANNWAMRARDYARDSKAAGAPADKAAYERGLAEGFYKAATELAELIKALPSDATVTASVPRSSPAAPAPAPATPASKPAADPAPAPAYLKLSLREALDVLTFAGTTPRDVQPRPDNSFMAVFSKWENVQPHERIEKIKKADLRLVILQSGTIKDTHDPFVVFAFKDQT